MLSSIRKMYEIYYFMKKITLIIMEGAQFDQSIVQYTKKSGVLQYNIVRRLADSWTVPEYDMEK